MRHFAKFAFIAGLFAAGLAAPALADEASPQSADNRLMIVDGATDRVIYDDGSDDLFCVTRVHHWHDEYGYRHRHRTMRCR